MDKKLKRYLKICGFTTNVFKRNFIEKKSLKKDYWEKSNLIYYLHNLPKLRPE